MYDENTQIYANNCFQDNKMNEFATKSIFKLADG